jgi:hypothetical protein
MASTRARVTGSGGGLATVTLAVQVYGAISGTGADGDLLAAAAAGALFLILSAIPVAA